MYIYIYIYLRISTFKSDFHRKTTNKISSVNEKRTNIHLYDRHQYAKLFFLDITIINVINYKKECDISEMDMKNYNSTVLENWDNLPPPPPHEETPAYASWLRE